MHGRRQYEEVALNATADTEKLFFTVFSHLMTIWRGLCPSKIMSCCRSSMRWRATDRAELQTASACLRGRSGPLGLDST
jgi:hypothetical protein